MKKGKFELILLLGAFILIVLGLMSPISNSLTVNKIDFAYQSISSKEFLNQYETILLGYQSFFGRFNVVLILILTGFLIFDKSKSATAVFTLFILYLVAFFIDRFLNGATLGKPIPTEYLIGYKFLLFGTFLLFVISFRNVLLASKREN